MNNNFKVGVGTITMSKRDIPDYQLPEHVTHKVFVDTERKGPGFGRNKLMKEFHDEGFDYWVIFDDDVFVTQPSHTNFIDEMVRIASEGNWDCFISPEYFRDNIVGAAQGGEVLLWNRGMTQFLMCTPKLIEVCGYMPKLNKAYGFEDSIYVDQIIMAQKFGLINNGASGLPCPAKMLCYLHPSDMFGDNKTPFSNMSQEEKQSHADENWQEYVHVVNKVRNGEFYVPFPAE